MSAEIVPFKKTKPRNYSYVMSIASRGEASFERQSSEKFRHLEFEKIPVPMSWFDILWRVAATLIIAACIMPML